jgi:carboxymethylenebutenolidase
VCYSDSAKPPAGPAPTTSAAGRQITLSAADGARFAAFLATPVEPSGVGVLLLPDHRGLRTFYQDLALRFAEHGHTTVAIDYFGRSGGVARNRPTDFPVLEHLGRLRRNTLYADFAAGIAAARAAGCRSVVSVGFCLGGRFAFLTADPAFGLAGAIGCYGAPDAIRDAPGPIQRAPELTAPVLALFGGADDGIPQDTITRFDDALAAAGVEHEIVTYPGAPHGFFDQEPAADHAAACADVWLRFLGFLAART